jgi:hypothetical protein
MTNPPPFLRNYCELRMPIIDADGAPLWPELFPIEKIDELRDTVGARHFSAQMMLEFISEERARLDPGALHFYDGEFNPRDARIERVESRELRVELNNSSTDTLYSPLSTLNAAPVTGAALYWDPSGGRHKADNSVCVLLYTDNKNRRAFIHDVLYLSVSDGDLHPLATQCDKVLDFMARHNVRIIGIEINGLGNALPEIMREVSSKRDQSVIVQKVINHQRKETRILDAIEPLLTTGRLFAHERVRSTPLLSEMLGWSPMGNIGHDDGLDALAGALRATPVPVRPLGQNFRPLQARTEFLV